MLIPFRDLLDEARERGGAVGAFTVYNLEIADAVLRAARERDRGVVLLLSSQALRSPIGSTLVAAVHGAAARAPARCCLQLDHETDLSRIRAALDAGMGAVMADGSKLPLADNAAFVRAAAELAGRHGAGVEAELGHIAGDEEVAAAAARGALTDPHDARDLLAGTGAACLAVSIGNVHGRYREPPALDWQRLARIREVVTAPLSLHGASGLDDADVRRAVAAGIAKVNVNTELRDRYFETLAARTGELRRGARLLRLAEELSAAVADVVAAKLELLEGRATPARG
jgi:tagatose 1,6-diphosphate aldolase GatY/KbaY